MIADLDVLCLFGILSLYYGHNWLYASERPRFLCAVGTMRLDGWVKARPYHDWFQRNEHRFVSSEPSSYWRESAHLVALPRYNEHKPRDSE
jgi:hypothetical protein